MTSPKISIGSQSAAFGIKDKDEGYSCQIAAFSKRMLVSPDFQRVMAYGAKNEKRFFEITVTDAGQCDRETEIY